MKKLFLLLLILAVFTPACYADVYTETGVTPYVVLKEAAAVHAAPDIAAARVELAPGTRVSIGEYATGGKLSNGKYINWYEVRYAADGKTVAGYMYTPDWLQNESLSYKDIDFVYEVTATEDGYGTQVIFKAVKNGQTLASHTMQVAREAVQNPLVTVISGNGLDGVAFVAKLSFNGEMCGIPIYDFYYAWAGDNLVKLPEAISMSGEGIETSYAESVILPANGAPWGTIVKTVATYEPVGGEDSYETKNDFAAQFYRWNGKEAVPVGQTPTILNWRVKDAQ